MYKAININSSVKIKLTDKGRKVYRNHLYDILGSIYRKNNEIEKLFNIDEDKQGYSTWQLWKLMSIFGSHIGMGSDICFETEIFNR